MCSPSTIVAVFVVVIIVGFIVLSSMVSPNGFIRKNNKHEKQRHVYVYIYIYILNWFLPLVCPSNKQHFMKRVPPNDFTRQEILCWLCYVFCLCLCCFPSLGLLIFVCCCCVSIPVFHLFVLNMVSPNGFARRVYAYLSCVHAVVIQYVLFNSIYIRIDLI